MESKISVIVPVFRVEKYLDRCVESIVNQTYKNLEIILVDDGSDDNCPKLCDSWALRDNRIRVIHKSNGGPSSARNEALDIVEGDFICFVDGDDWISPNFYEIAMDIFEKNDVDIVNFDCYRVMENKKELGGTETVSEGALYPEEALGALIRGKINNYMWNKMFKCHIFADIRFPVGRSWEDMAICYKLFMKAERIYCSTEKVYFYLQRPDSLSATISAKAVGDVYIARRDTYLGLKDIYPRVGEILFPKVALCALRLYDRSLWAKVEPAVLADAQRFLEKNREKILSENGSLRYWLYFRAPKYYVHLRKVKHKIGDMVKYVEKVAKCALAG